MLSVHPHPASVLPSPLVTPGMPVVCMPMRRFLEHRGITGSTAGSSPYNLERHIRDFIAQLMQEVSPTPEHVSQAVLERYQRHLYYYPQKMVQPSIASRCAGKIVLLSGASLNG